jgi:hypothetical protein
MKNYILSFFLGVALTISLGAAVQSSDLLVFKPARPTSTVVFTERDEDVVAKKIREYASQGYIVKEIAVITSDSSMFYQFVVVMEKY